MPAIIAIVAVVALVGAGAYFFTSTPDTTETAAEPAARTEVAANPETVIVDTPESGEPPEPEAEPAALPDATPDDSAPVATEAAPEPAAAEPAEAAEPAATGPVTYESDVSYTTPGGTSHDMTISLTLNNGVVVGADVVYDGGEGYSNNHQRRFDAAFEGEVLGQSLSSISLSRVGGASLTSEAFNDAVADISTQADAA